MNAITVPERQSVGFGLMPQSMGEAMELAKIMAGARMVPKCLQGSVGDCFMVVEQALRWNMSPFAVAQCTSSIGGKLMYEGKLVAAAVETSGAIVGNMDHEFTGTGDSREIRMWANRRGDTGPPREVKVKLSDVRTSNEMWKRQPDQQLVYSGSRVWARAWTPAVILGVYAPEEFDKFKGTTIQGSALDVAVTEDALRSEATDEPDRCVETGEILPPPPPRKPKRTPLEQLIAHIATLPDVKACVTLLDPGTRAKGVFDASTLEQQAEITAALHARHNTFVYYEPAKDDAVPDGLFVTTGADDIDVPGAERLAG